jgi:hypothetical protein
MKPTNHRLPWSSLLGAALLILNSCGGGSVDSGGIGGSGYVSGPIEDFGSIVVQGIRFDVESATVTIDGEIVSSEQLRLGMMVGISGSLDPDLLQGVAAIVEFEEDIRGPIEEINLEKNSLSVLGTTVETNQDTVFSGLTLETAMIGSVIRVSGFVEADDLLLATRVDLRAEGESTRARGNVRALDAEAKTFRLGGGLLIDYSAAHVVRKELLGNSALVAVHGTLGSGQRKLQAELIRVLDPAGTADAGTQTIISGFVTDPPVAGQFQLGTARTVAFNDETVFENGTVKDLTVRAKVRVRGRTRANRINIAADRITILPQGR